MLGIPIQSLFADALQIVRYPIVFVYVAGRGWSLATNKSQKITDIPKIPSLQTLLRYWYFSRGIVCCVCEGTASASTGWQCVELEAASEVGESESDGFVVKLLANI